KDLAVMFMAAAPRNVEPVLDFEGEEAGILAATDNLPLALTVEESGSADFLKNRLADDGPFEVMHLTCHGEIGKDGPVLALDDEGGDLAFTSAGTLAATLGSEKPGLLFLSACRTAENDGPTAPFAIQLMRAGVPAVLGWDGSVRDIDASAFARETYAELARHERPVFAVASARQRLLAQHRADQQKGQHWHLARLYVGANGGGALCARNAKMRPVFRGRAYSAFLDTERKKVPVAGPAAFVGRRRALQNVFRAFRDPATCGVLIHGFGGQGKSSLAARVADRLTHHKPALVFEFYDAQAVFDQALQAVIGDEAVVLRKRWQPLIAENASNLKDALVDILNGPCAAYELDAQARVARQPMLLIIDDLERILEKPGADDAAVAVNAAHRPVLTAVLEAFTATSGATESRLLLTSRYDFALKNAMDADLAARLARVPLRPFDDLEQEKQQRAAARNEPDGGEQASKAEEAKQDALLARCRKAAHGNPLVQATLTRAVLSEESGVAEAVLKKMEGYLAGGAAPDAGELADMFKRLAFEVYTHALSKDEASAFRALTLFELPVPENAARAAVALLAHEAADAALTRLNALGLTDRFEPYWKDGETELLANALARPHFGALSEDEQRTLAKAALSPLLAAWSDADGDLPPDPRSLEVFRLAALAGDAAAQGNAARWGGRWLFDKQHSAEAALSLVQTALEGRAVLGADRA
ncbi:MAG: CHAT domain-containing protein, partial [Alphaproteobacteria bacterium]